VGCRLLVESAVRALDFFLKNSISQRISEVKYMKLFTLPLIIKESKACFTMSEVISEGRSMRFEYAIIFEVVDFIVEEGVRKSDYIFL